MRLLRAAFCAVVMLAATPGVAGVRDLGASSDFQLVESVPVATVYGEPGVPRTQAVWLQMIREARHGIDIAAFYIADKPGSALSPVLDALIKQADTGIKVRILVDQSFLKDSQAGIDHLRQSGHIEIRVLPTTMLTGGVLHAKYMVVDGANVFVGSQNWDWRALDQIHEIGARICNRRFAQTFTAAFDFDWQLAAQPDLPKTAKAAVESPMFAPVTAEDPVLLDGHGDDPLIAYPAFSPPALMPRWVTTEQSALLRMIEGSRHMLRIQVMTLSAFRQYGPKGWWGAIDSALRDAAARGVQVHIIVADWALKEPTQTYLKSLTLMPGISVRFSQLPPSPEGFIAFARVEHAKYAIADDRSVYIGNGNWEWAYFNASVDASVFVQGAGPARTLTHIFDQNWNGSYVTALDPGRSYPEPRTH
jgi:phospholipase D3/4